MGAPCRVTFGDRVFFKPDFVKRFLDTLHLEDNVVENSKYLKSIGYDNAFNEGDPLLIREKKAEAKAEAKAEEKKAEAPKAGEKKAEPSIDNVAQKAGISPKNIRDLYNINRELFSLNQVKALASAVAMDRMIGVMAKRAGVTKAEMYGKLKFEKASEQDLPNNALMQGVNSALYELSVASIDITNLLDVLEPDKIILYNDFAKKAAELQKKYDKPINEQDAAFVKSFRDNLLTTIDNAISFWESAYKQKSVLNKEGDLSHVKVNLLNRYKERIDKLKSSRDVIAEQLLSPQDIKMSKMGSVLFQVDAWHGSPYEFDKFQTEFMGKGEGAQAFGWGLYFTDLESIARSYAEKLTASKIIDIDGNPTSILDLPTSYFYDPNNYENANQLKEAIIKDIQENTEKIQRQIDNQLSKENPNTPYVNNLRESISNNNRDINKINSQKWEFKKPNRNLYKVSLNKGKSPEQYTWLEWDKPVSDEAKAKVKEELTKLGISTINDGYRSTSYINGEKVEEVIPPKDALEGEFTGKQLYEYIALSFSGSLNEIQKEASLLLLRAGVDGIKYPAESVSRGATSGTARGFNYVVFDENAVSIEEAIKFQKDAEKARGAMMITLDGQATIYALTDPNVSTPLHELAHVFEHYLTDGEKKAVMDAANTKEWNTKTSEYFARGFEKYLAEGKSPIAALDKIFAKFKEWLTDIYNGILGSDIDIKLNDEMRNIYAQMLGKEIVNKPASQKTSIFDDFDSTNKGKSIKSKAEANKAFKEKYGEDAAVAKAISSNFEAIAEELKAKGIFTKIKC
jgi:hypothetical protein